MFHEKFTFSIKNSTTNTTKSELKSSFHLTEISFFKDFFYILYMFLYILQIAFFLLLLKISNKKYIK